VVSGFVMISTTHGRHVTPRDFAARRLARIVPAYWIWTSIVAVLALALPNGLYPYASVAAAKIVESFGLSIFFIPHQNPAGLGPYPLLTAGWSLNYEMLFYAVFAASLVVQGPRQSLLVALLLVGLSTFWPWRFPLSEFLHNKLIWEFLYGVLLGWLYSVRRLPTSRWAGWVSILLGITLIVSFTAAHRALTWGGGSLLIVYGVLCLEDLAAKAPFLIRLGDLSYSTYLAQGVIPLMLRDIYRSIAEPALWPAFLLVTIISVYCLSIIGFDLVESRVSPRLQRLLSRAPGA